jgi:hypothetical protein
MLNANSSLRINLPTTSLQCLLIPKSVVSPNHKKPKAQKACAWVFGEKSVCQLQKAIEKSCNNVIKERKE